MRVLVVDDDDLVRAEVAGLLELEAMTVVEASDGRSALAALEAGGVDVVVSDWHMPGMDGLTLLAAMRATAAGASIPFLLLTGSGIPPDAAVPRPDAVLRKPVAIDDLLGTLRRLGGGRR